MKPRSVLTAVLFAIALPVAASPVRGIWWWTSPGHPWGSDQVIGDPAKEKKLLRFLSAWEIGEVYTAFSKQAWSKPEQIRAWNERVHAAGKKSQLLLSENTWIAPANRPNLLKVHLQRELIDFNANVGNPHQRFDAVHLDIEPHGLPGWETMQPESRKKLLFQFRDTLREVRTYLDGHGAKEIPVYADLPVWFDEVGGPVGWTSAAERDAWFSELGKSLTGISLMAYERNTADKIESGVKWELRNFKDEVRVGLEVSVGPGKTWKTLAELVAMIRKQESKSPSRPVDIHDLIQFHDAVTERPN